MIKAKKIQKWDNRFLSLADLVASWSKDPSTKTGAVITTADRKVVSLGYNGFPMMMNDDPALYEDREVKYERIVHCEMNAVLSAPNGVEGCILYTMPFLSCPRCAVHMIQAGIFMAVAPRVPEDKLERWGPAIERTKSFFREAGVSYTEVDLRTQHVWDEFDALEEVAQEIEDARNEQY